MRVLSKKRLVEAWTQHPELYASLNVWYRVVKAADWKSIVEVRKTFSTADPVGSCTVFNIKGNSYRLVCWVNYTTQKVFIRNVLTHSEYSKGDWKHDCFNH